MTVVCDFMEFCGFRGFSRISKTEYFTKRLRVVRKKHCTCPRFTRLQYNLCTLQVKIFKCKTQVFVRKIHTTRVLRSDTGEGTRLQTRATRP